MKFREILEKASPRDYSKFNIFLTKNIDKTDKQITLSNDEKTTYNEAFSYFKDTEYRKHVCNVLRNDFLLDIAADILIKEGHCIMSVAEFSEQFKKQFEIVYSDVNQNWLSKISLEEADILENPRNRDYHVYAECVKEAFLNNEESFSQNFGVKNVSTEENSILACLARNLGLSHWEARAIFIAVLISSLGGKTKGLRYNLDDVIDGLVSNAIVIRIRKENNKLYCPEEVVDVIRGIRGIGIERKYLRRIVSNMDDRMLNLIRARHSISRCDREEKERRIIDQNIDIYELLSVDIFDEGIKENDKKRIFNDFISKKLGIDDSLITGRTLEQKIKCLIDYYQNDLNERNDFVSIDGYKELLRKLGDRKVRAAMEKLDLADLLNQNDFVEELQRRDVFAKDILYLFSDDELRELCDESGIQYFKSDSTSKLVTKIIDSVSTAENRLIEYYDLLARGASAELAEKGINISSLSEMGNKFQSTTQTIFEKLGLKVVNYPNPSGKKEFTDIMLEFDEGLVIVECKSHKEKYSDFASTLRQVKSYCHAYSSSYNVIGAVLVSWSFTEDFIKKAESYTELDCYLALLRAEDLKEIYFALKDEKKFSISSRWFFGRTIIDPKTIISAAIRRK